MRKYTTLLLVILLAFGTLIGCSTEPEVTDTNQPSEPEQTNELVEAKEAKEITLYFGGPDAMKVVAEKRTIEVDKNIQQTELLKIVIEELIKGPTSENIYRTIPEEVKVLSVKIEKDILYVDFSEEMHSKHWGGATGEAMTVASILNTLTEFDNITQVMMTVEGESLSIEHMIMEEPMGRQENMIQK